MNFISKLLFIVILVLYVPVYAADVSFVWDANSEPDLAGYRLYWSTVSGEYTCVYDDADTVNLVADIPCGALDTACAKYTQTDISVGVYYWVVTAYDTEGYESAFSNEVTTTIEDGISNIILIFIQ